MGNRFGNYPTEQAAIDALVDDGFTFTGTVYRKPCDDGAALVQVTSYPVSGEYADDGVAYRVFQHHFL